MEKTSLETFRVASGAMAQVNVNQSTPNPHNDFVSYGTKGRITGKGLMRSRAGGVLEVLVGGKLRTQEFPAINAHGACVAAFSKALLDGGELQASGIDGLRSVQLTDAMGRSVRDGVHVQLSY